MLLQEVQCTVKYVDSSPYKARRILKQLKNRSYAEALIILSLMPYKASYPILNLLRSLGTKAERQLITKRKSLVISTALANQAPTLKRMRPRAQGRGYAIKKRRCHICLGVKSTIN
uniref:Large ribosomal subunit protein uL22c n=1 Tax=Gloeochaete wittrockiana TaxID=38269 RepID=A0A3G1IVY7_9EUKA|nr:ribosomal protein L22 [Gloeochaete wittrockiana]ASQ40218.1 ribosomal protein L22 [Gloeochaete wittrockiana]